MNFVKTGRVLLQIFIAVAPLAVKALLDKEKDQESAKKNENK